jgi:hypothetical protein
MNMINRKFISILIAHLILDLYIMIQRFWDEQEKKPFIILNIRI